MTLKRDRERIEEEKAGIARLERPRTLASDYLHQAAEAFQRAGDPGYLYEQWRPDRVRLGAGRVFMVSWAREERFRQARTCALFAALAAEAYVNEFIAAFDLSKTQLKKLDDMSTVRKYIDGVTRVYGDSVFYEGDEVMPTLTKLFRLRHELVHPKPGLGSPGLLAEADPELEAKFAMPDLAEYIVMVGGAADTLVWRAYGHRQMDVPGRSLWVARDAIRQFAERTASLPEPDGPAEPSIWHVVGQRIDELQVGRGQP